MPFKVNPITGKLDYFESGGIQGPQGDSAYEVAVANGYGETEQNWLLSLVGAQGPSGQDSIVPGPQGLQGDDGTEIELQKSVTHVQWRYVGAAEWTNLVALADITGSAGADGDTGAAGADGTDGLTILNGAVDPTTEGVNGDFYINTASNKIFGPKAAGVWPAGVNIVGPAGADGSDGADGADGTVGLPGPAGGTLLLSDVLAAVYPIGSIYIATVSTNPNTLFGFGTWAAFGAGRVIVGLDSGDANFDTAEETGGSKTVQSSAQTFGGTAFTDVINHTHTITDSGHSHLQRYGAASGNFAVHVGDTSGGGTGGSASLTNEQATASGTANCTSANPAGGVANITPAGTNTPGAATSVVQPYIVAYMWKRTE